MSRSRLGGSFRTTTIAAGAATIALIAAGVLGVAAAEAPTMTTTVPQPTVSVQGVANEPIDQSANVATATAVYRQGMADALSDGKAKAQFLAEKAGVTLGAVQSIVEEGGYIECAGNEEYLGEQPDFGSSGTYMSPAGVSTPRAVAQTPSAKAHKPTTKHGKKKKKKKRSKSPTAKPASASGCTLAAQVSVVYALG